MLVLDGIVIEIKYTGIKFTPLKFEFARKVISLITSQKNE